MPTQHSTALKALNDELETVVWLRPPLDRTRPRARMLLRLPTEQRWLPVERPSGSR